MGLDLRTRVGFAPNRRLALFLDGRAEVPMPPTFLAWPTLAYAGVGVGAMWFREEGGPWHFEFGVRRAWARRFDKATNTLVLLLPRPVNHLDQVWLAEVGLGHSRRGQSGRTQTLSFFGGLARPSDGSGWMVGIAYTVSLNMWTNLPRVAN